MRDMMNCCTPKRAISPAAATTDNTAFVSQIIDVQGYDSLTFLIQTGSLADADATFTTLVEHGDDSSLTDAAAVADAELLGTEALASFTFADDNKCFKIGYVGSKRYVRLTVTPANNSGNAFVSAIALLGHPAQRPTANPPA
ncbi:hypothetical protein [Azospirillum sp.]|uniref:hypothetical protein n=1 Tax=Azospirillum sp. TaxID=34012 RepID=UPI003D72D56C